MEVTQVVIQFVHVGAEVVEVALACAPRLASGALLHLKGSRDAIIVGGVELWTIGGGWARRTRINVRGGSSSGGERFVAENPEWVGCSACADGVARDMGKVEAAAHQRFVEH